MCAPTSPRQADSANSIKTLGILEPVTVYLAVDGTYAVLRGKRRTLTAAKGRHPERHHRLPWGGRPEDADHIGGQPPRRPMAYIESEPDLRQIE